MKSFFGGIIFLFLFVNIAFAQIGLQPLYFGTTAEALQLAEKLVGSGVTVSNATFTGTISNAGTGQGANCGLFSNGNSSLGLSAGIVLSSGNIADLPVNNGGSNSKDWSAGGDVTLTAVVGAQTYDAIGLQFDFIPDGNYISFRYVWGSDEYNEYVGSNFNDAFAFYLTSLDLDGYGYNNKNIALIPGTSSVVSINNVNKTTNSSYYRDNESGAISIEPDGMTIALNASAAVKACSRYRLKIVIGDVADHSLDSWVFIEEKSFNSSTLSNVSLTFNPISAGTNAVEGCNTISCRFTLGAPAEAGGRKIAFSLGGTAAIITDYTVSPNITPTYNTIFPGKYYVTVPSGQTYIDLLITALYDGITEGDETIIPVIDKRMCSIETISETITIKDRSPLSVNITNPDPESSCVTGGITLNALPAGGWINGGAYTFSWSPSSGLSATNISNPLATPINNTTYTLTITDACGNTATTTQAVEPFHASGNFGQWFGDISSDWDDCRNWGKGKIPDNNIDVIIPTSGVTNWPIKTGDFTIGTDCKSLTLQNNSTITITENISISNGKTFTCIAVANIFVGGNWLEGSTSVFNRGNSIVTFIKSSGMQEVNNGINRTYSFWDVVVGTGSSTNIVKFYYDGSIAGNKININNIDIKTGANMATYKQ